MRSLLLGRGEHTSRSGVSEDQRILRQALATLPTTSQRAKEAAKQFVGSEKDPQRVAHYIKDWCVAYEPGSPTGRARQHELCEFWIHYFQNERECDPLNEEMTPINWASLPLAPDLENAAREFWGDSRGTVLFDGESPRDMYSFTLSALGGEPDREFAAAASSLIGKLFADPSVDVTEEVGSCLQEAWDCVVWWKLHRSHNKEEFISDALRQSSLPQREQVRALLISRSKAHFKPAVKEFARAIRCGQDAAETFARSLLQKAPTPA